MSQIRSLRRYQYLLLAVSVLVAALLVLPLRAHAASSTNPKPQSLMNAVTTFPGDLQTTLLAIPGFGTIYVMPVDYNHMSCFDSVQTTMFVASSAVTYMDTTYDGAYASLNAGDTRWIYAENFLMATGSGASAQVASVHMLQRTNGYGSDCKSIVAAQVGPAS